MKEEYIHIEQLSLQYKGSDTKAIDDFNLSIKKGEIFGLLGPNGAGKTTLMSLLTGVLQLHHGKIEIDGLAIQHHKKKVQEKMGFVPQEYALYPKLTAKENLMFFGKMTGLHGPRLKTAVSEGIDKMGLASFANKRINTFSGGMKRRINLLAGVLHQPEIIVLDEPTVGVDVHSKQVIIDYLKQLNRDGATIVYSSHLLHQAQNFCTRIAIIESGKIKVEGKTEGILLKNGKVRTLEELFVEYTSQNNDA